MILQVNLSTNYVAVVKREASIVKQCFIVDACPCVYSPREVSCSINNATVIKEYMMTIAVTALV